jgi:hypothetical protein
MNGCRMPRARPNTSSRTFLTRGHPLSDASRLRLIQLLGFGSVNFTEETVRHQFPGMRVLDKQPGAPLQLVRDGEPRADRLAGNLGRTMLNIELALGVYVDGAEHIDNPPRPADYIRAFNSLRSRAMDLYDTLTGLTDYYVDQLAVRGADADELAKAVASVADISTAVIKDFDGRSSKGARKETALTQVARQLKRIFRDNYCGPVGKRRKSGGITHLPDHEKAEKAFVRAALLDARIISNTFDISRLLRDSRCALPEERNTVIERLARKTCRGSNLTYTFPESDPLRLARATKATKPRTRRSEPVSTVEVRKPRTKRYAR